MSRIRTTRCSPAHRWWLPALALFSAHSLLAADRSPTPATAHSLPPPATTRTTPSESSDSHSIDLQSVIERAQHMIQPEGKGEALLGQDRDYLVRFEEGLTHFSLQDEDSIALQDRLPPVLSLEWLGLETDHGRDPWDLDALPQQTVVENTLSNRWEGGLTESFRLRNGHVEHTLSLGQVDKNAGSLRIWLQLRHDGDSVLDGQGLWLVDALGREALLTLPVVHDGAGNISLPRVTLHPGEGGSLLEIEVSGGFLRTAQGPLTLEHGWGRPTGGWMDQTQQNLIPTPSHDFTISDAPAEQMQPQIADNGSIYLVVWADSRNNNADIFAARVTHDNCLLDVNGIQVSTNTENEYSPRVASNGSDFMVVWDHQNMWGRHSVEGRLVSGAGVPGSFFNPATNASEYSQPDVAWCAGQNNYLVVWRDQRNGGSDIYGHPVSTSGTPVGASDLAISTASGDQFSPSVQTIGSTALVAWTDARNSYEWDVYGTIVSGCSSVATDANGQPVATSISSASSYQLYPQVATDGTGFVAVWEDGRNGNGYDVYAAAINSSGVVTSAVDGTFVTGGSGDQNGADLSYNGSNYMVVWEDRGTSGQSNLKSMEVSAAANPVGSVVALTNYGAGFWTREPAVIAGAFGYLVTYRHHFETMTTATDSNIRAVVDGTQASLAVLDNPAVQLSTVGYANNPDVAWGGSNFLVVWEQGSSNPDLFGILVNPNGTLASSILTIASAANYQSHAAVAGGNGSFVVVWEDNRTNVSFFDVFARQVSGSGTPLQSPEVAVASGRITEYRPDVAWSQAGKYLVVWQESNKIRGSRLELTGAANAPTVTDPSGLGIALQGAAVYDPAVASDGTDYLVVWRDDRNAATTWSDIFGTRVGTNGVVQNSQGIAIDTTNTPQNTPAVAHGLCSYMVAWSQGNGALSLGAALVDSNTSVLKNAILASSNIAGAPDIAAGTDGFLVAFPRTGNGTDIFATRLDFNGTVIDPSGISLEAQSFNQDTPSVAFGSGEYYLAYQGVNSGNVILGARLQ